MQASFPFGRFVQPLKKDIHPPCTERKKMIYTRKKKRNLYFYWGFFASPKPWHHPFNLRYAQAHRTA
jgi:hypothetical protein